MKLHKILSLTLVLVLLFSLVACGKKAAPAVTTALSTTVPATDPPETSVPPTTVPEDLNGWIIDEDMQDYTGTVRVYSAFKLSLGMDKMIEEFNTYYPNITIDWNTYSNNSDSGMHINTILIHSADVIHSFGLNYTYARWEDGLFMDITDKLAEEGIDMVENWGTDVYRYGGRYYSIPCGGLQYYVAINKTAWDEAGLGEIPTQWTWDEYIEACRKMTKVSDDGSVRYGGSSYSSINTILYCGAQVNGGDLYYSADGKKSNYDDPVVIKAFERELNAELTEKIWFPLATYRAQGIKDYQTFLTGQVASTVTTNVVRYITDAAYEETSDFITAFAPFPTEEEGQTNYMSGVHVYSHVGIGANCQDETAAWLFTKFYATYGVKYLAVAGHHSNWRGTTAEDIVNAVYGSEEEAAKYVDVESFKHVIGRTDLPVIQDTVSDFTIKTYSRLTGFLKDPFFKALQSEMTAEEALTQAAQEANAYLDNMAGH